MFLSYKENKYIVRRMEEQIMNRLHIMYEILVHKFQQFYNFFKYKKHIKLFSKCNELIFLFYDLNTLKQNGILSTFSDEALIVFGNDVKHNDKFFSEKCIGINDMNRQQIETIVNNSKELKSIKVFDKKMDLEDSFYERLAFNNNLTLEFFICSSEKIEKRVYTGEKLHRVYYSKSYFSLFFPKILPIKGQRILDAGCSDGLICDLLSFSSPEKLFGIDISVDEKTMILNDKVKLSACDICKTNFDNLYFDTIFSIATFEHVHSPIQAIYELYRILKHGGYLCIQAGPLWFSPFGHHMFGYFDNMPWIHLRMSPEEIANFAKKHGLDKKIEETTHLSCIDYINSMFSLQHVNKYLYSEYSLKKLAKKLNMEIVDIKLSYEGRELINDKIFEEISTRNKRISRSDLFIHGFSVIFKK